MQFILRTSSWLPATAMAFLLISLSTILALSQPSMQGIGELPAQNKPSYSLTLPTIMAPLIRKEVRKETTEESKTYGQGLPDLFGAFIQLF